MKQYRLVNNVLGWVTFAIAAFTYCSTVEPSASFWDCPEFITTAYKLEIGHPPGAPFFMLFGNLFTQFTSDVTKVALMVNIMSALLSALCILFLFWSITHLARKLICENGVPQSWQQTALIMACGLTGALAYTWSDTFWFSAVEGEVYAFSSMFTALVFWLILKWEDHADEPGADRWLVLIFYLTGISIGVHLLNLLCLPAIALVYYYRKNPSANVKGSLIALCVSMMLVAAVLYGVVPGIVKVGGWFELFFVNTLGLGFNTGVVIYIFVLVAVVLAAIWSTTRSDRKLINLLYVIAVALLGIPFYGKGFSAILLGVVVLGALYYALGYKLKGEYLLRKRALNTSLLCMLMLMIGYSSYAVIVVRSTANTPMDQNSPEDIFSLGKYLNREQYGTRPLFYGQAYTSEFLGVTKETNVQRHEKKDASEPDRYDEVEVTGSYRFADAQKMLFPRIYSRDHAQAYEDWLGGVDKRVVMFDVTDENGVNLGQYPGEMPSQWDNLRFLFSYQINFMYWRYFMWNFAGRQNDVQGFGEAEHGNWLTGIPFIDRTILGLGDQSQLPEDLLNNKGHNVFYCLPLLLGLLGLFWQAYRGERGVRQFWVVFFLFFMTGLAIVLYLNQTPQQPRERDYAYAGSFYAFAIWIGLGVAALASLLKRALKNEKASVAVASVLGILVPLQMVSQTWDDHDRSGRYAARDFGGNYLSSLPEDGKAIIFTNGDNDTFPLWYTQEVEGKHTDARVCNLSYLQTDWYTDQMRRPAYDSPALPIAWHRYEYVDNMGHDLFRVQPEKEKLEAERTATQDPFDLKYLIDHYVRTKGYMPTDSVIVKVNKENVIKSGMMLPGGKDSIPDHISISFRNKQAISKSEMMIYEILARNDWKRPLYMSVTLGGTLFAGLDDYLVLEGLAYRITPFRMGQGAIDTDKMYDNLMNRFRYGGVNNPKIYLDETNMRMCYTHRRMFGILAEALVQKGDKARAIAVLKRCDEVLPFTTIPASGDMLSQTTNIKLADLWLAVGNKPAAARIYADIARISSQYLVWANTLRSGYLSSIGATCLRNFAYLQDAIEGLERCGSAQAATYRMKLQTLSNTPSGAAGASYMQQQQMRQQQQALPAIGTENGGGDALQTLGL